MRQEVIQFVDDVLVPLDYRVTQLDGSPLPDKTVRYHLLAMPAQPRT